MERLSQVERLRRDARRFRDLPDARNLDLLTADVLEEWADEIECGMERGEVM